MKWVHSVVNSLNLCKEIRSSAHPESIRDQVSKSGRTKAPGWYNFGVNNGTRLAEIKRSCDRRNVFSLASRVSWGDGNSISGLRDSVSNEVPLEEDLRVSSEDQALHNTVGSFGEDPPIALNTEGGERNAEATSLAKGRKSSFENDDIEEFETEEEFRRSFSSNIHNGSSEWDCERANEESI